MVFFLLVACGPPVGKTFDSEPVPAEGALLEFDDIGSGVWVPAGAFPEGTVVSVTAERPDADFATLDGVDHELSHFGLVVESDAPLESGQTLWLGVPSSWGNNWEGAGAIVGMVYADGAWSYSEGGGIPPADSGIDPLDDRSWMTTSVVPAEVFQGFQPI